MTGNRKARCPRDFLVSGDLRQPAQTWLTHEEIDPAELAAAWLQYQVVQTLLRNSVSTPRMSDCLMGETANSIRAKFRGDRPMDLADFLRWAMAIEPGLLSLLPSQLTDLSEVLPPEAAGLLVSRTPGAYRRPSFAPRDAWEGLAWQQHAQELNSWISELANDGLAWSIKPAVLRGEILRVIRRAGVRGSLLVPIDTSDEDTFALIDNGRTHVILGVCAAPGGGTAHELETARAEVLTRIWESAGTHSDGVTVVIATSPAARAMIMGAIEPRVPASDATWTVTLQHAESAGLRGVDIDWPDLQLSRPLGDGTETDRLIVLHAASK